VNSFFCSLLRLPCKPEPLATSKVTGAVVLYRCARCGTVSQQG